jgi:hypothetical protein
MPISGHPHRANLVRERALIGGTRPVLDGASVA